MKLLISGDIHGSAHYAGKLCQIFDDGNYDKLVLLGDLLYHGPRNPLPEKYAPQEVFDMLNARKDKILAARGNCDSEVDQMVLDFPMMGDSVTIFDGDTELFFTHGHVFNEQAMPKFKKGSVLIHGHTHLRELADKGDYVFLNPGSLSLPKGDGVHSYAVYDSGTFTTHELNSGEVIEKFSLK